MELYGVAILATQGDKTWAALIYFAAICGIIVGILDVLCRPRK
jgi:hypothetical protein